MEMRYFLAWKWPKDPAPCSTARFTPDACAVATCAAVASRVAALSVSSLLLTVMALPPIFTTMRLLADGAASAWLLLYAREPTVHESSAADTEMEHCLDAHRCAILFVVQSEGDERARG